MVRIRKTESGREYKEIEYNNGIIRILYPKAGTTQSHIVMAVKEEFIIGSVSFQGNERTYDTKTDKPNEDINFAIDRCKQLIDLLNDAVQSVQTQEV